MVHAYFLNKGCDYFHELFYLGLLEQRDLLAPERKPLVSVGSEWHAS